jgi:hypothetical protein
MLSSGHCSDEGGRHAKKCFIADGRSGVGRGPVRGPCADHGGSRLYLTFEEIGANVEAVGGGSFNLAALQLDDMTSDNAFVFAQGAAELTGPTTVTPIDVYIGITGPTSFGPGTSSFGPTSGSGDLAGLMGGQDLTVPRDYVSGALLSDESVYANQSFASLGLTPTYMSIAGARERPQTA